MGKISHSHKIPNLIDNGNSQWNGGVEIGGKLYCVPSKSNYIMIYDP